MTVQKSNQSAVTVNQSTTPEAMDPLAARAIVILIEALSRWTKERRAEGLAREGC